MFDVTIDKDAQEVLVALEHLSQFPEKVRKDMVAAKAKVVAEMIQFNAAKMLQGPYNQYEVARSVKAGKPSATKSGASCKIQFQGMQHGNRLAEIAFVNEYGKKSQNARPFIKTSIKEAGQTAEDAASEVLDKYLKSLGL